MAQLRAKGLTCIEAKDGYEAIYLTRTEHPELIVLDVSMPKMDGFKVVEVLRHEIARTTPLIIYSGKELTADERQLLTLGVTRYLTKADSHQQDLGVVVCELMGGLILSDSGRRVEVLPPVSGPSAGYLATACPPG